MSRALPWDTSVFNGTFRIGLKCLRDSPCSWVQVSSGEAGVYLVVCFMYRCSIPSFHPHPILYPLLSSCVGFLWVWPPLSAVPRHFTCDCPCIPQPAMPMRLPPVWQFVEASSAAATTTCSPAFRCSLLWAFPAIARATGRRHCAFELSPSPGPRIPVPLFLFLELVDCSGEKMPAMEPCVW